MHLHMILLENYDDAFPISSDLSPEQSEQGRLYSCEENIQQDPKRIE